MQDKDETPTIDATKVEIFEPVADFDDYEILKENDTITIDGCCDGGEIIIGEN